MPVHLRFLHLLQESAALPIIPPTASHGKVIAAWMAAFACSCRCEKSSASTAACSLQKHHRTAQQPLNTSHAHGTGLRRQGFCFGLQPLHLLFDRMSMEAFASIVRPLNFTRRIIAGQLLPSNRGPKQVPLTSPTKVLVPSVGSDLKT